MPTSVAKTGAGHGIGGDLRNISSRGSSMYAATSDTRLPEIIFIEAEVLDITLDASDPFNLGSIRFRPFTDLGRDKNSANSAWPLSTNIRTYPVIGETVAIFLLFSRYFYIFPSNNLNYINNNAFKNVGQQKGTSNEDNLNSYQSTIASGIPNSTTDSSNQDLIGNVILDQKESIPILTPNEGDLIIEGRVGNCIRFGYNPDTNLPNIKMSLLSQVSKPYSSIVESLDDDNCLWMTSDESLAFTKTGVDIDSRNNPPATFDGKQIMLSSDRIIFSSKNNEVIVFSNKGIYNSSKNNFGVDSGDAILMNSQNNIEINSKQQQIILTSADSTILNAPHIYMGDKDAKEPLVLGNKWSDLIGALIDAILSATYPTAAGPSGTAINAADFQRIKQQIRDTLSIRNFTK